MSNRLLGLAVTALVFASGASAVYAQADVVAQRQAAMRGMGAGVGAIRTAAGAGDFATAEAKAKDLASAVHALPGLFPAGSGPESGAKTRAKPEIWSDSAGFTAAAGKAAAAADNLVAAAASKNADQVNAAVAAFQGTCGGCHTPYRGPAAS